MLYKIQQELNIDSNDNEVIENVSFDCEYCKRSFSSKHRLEKHFNICVSHYKQKLKSKEDEIEQLKDQLWSLEKENILLKDEIKTVKIQTELDFYKQSSKDNQTTINEIAKQPRVQTTNNQNKILITTPLYLSKENIQTTIESGFSQEHLILGQRSVTQFAYNNLLKDQNGKLKYICTHPSRQIFKFKSNDGKMQKDVRALKLTQAIIEGDIKKYIS